MAKKHLMALGAAAAFALVFTGCSGAASSSDQSGGEITGEITVLTNRTDLVDSDLPAYAKKFEAKYPGTSVKFEAVQNYDQDVVTRLAGGAAGDVLALPNGLTESQVKQYFAPLGKTDDMSKKFRFASEYSYDGDTYAISLGGVASGMVVNKKVFEDAGVTTPPKTPEEFLDALKAVKDNTDAIPYYTNYKDGWPVTFFDNERAIMGDPDILETWADQKTLWDEGKYAYIADGLLYNIVHDKLSEDDPLTTNWEQSKSDIATGKIGSMLLGSWAVPQMKTAATDAGADPDDIAFWPFPYQTDGTFRSKISGDRVSAVSATSKNQATAKAWIEWMNTESGFAQDQGAIPVAIDSELPQAIQDFADSGVELVELAPAVKNAGKEAEIYRTAEIDGTIYRQQLIDIARGAAPGDWDSFTADMNKRWGDAQAEVMGG